MRNGKPHQQIQARQWQDLAQIEHQHDRKDEYPDRKQRDEAQTAMMEDAGYTVLRFADESGWASLVAGHPNVFGKPFGPGKPLRIGAGVKM